MTEIIFFAFAMTLTQIGDAYLRYLPFSRELTERDVTALKKRYAVWSVFGFAINVALAADGVSYRAYKLSALLIGWIPYVLLSTTVIRSRAAQHVFVFGMQSTWSFTVHAFAGMGVALIYGTMSEEHILLQLTFYLLIFAALLRVGRKFFTQLLPAPQIFEDSSLKWYMSILPTAIFIGTAITIIDVTFVTTWKERLSRICLPIFFLLMYRAINTSTRQVEEVQRQEQRVRLLRRQTESLREHNALMQKSRREVVALREDLGRTYRVIDELLDAGEISEAMAHIRRQAHLLDATTIKVFCLAPLVNAALSIYFKRAEEVGIKVRHKIDLPAQFSTDESDLAILLSNLLENAITASEKQKPSARDLSVIIRYGGGQYVLEVANRYDYPIKLGDNGLPYTSKIGHGLGMSSLETFAKKYDAYVDFSCEDNRVRLSLYWRD